MIEKTVRVGKEGDLDHYIGLNCFKKIDKDGDKLILKVPYSKNGLDLIFELRKIDEIDIRGYKYTIKWLNNVVTTKKCGYKTDFVSLKYKIHKIEYAY